MDTEEINKYIHEKILGKCWHSLQWVARRDVTQVGTWKCTCGLKIVHPRLVPNPDYCSDDSPRRLLNEVSQKIMDECSSIGDGLLVSFFNMTHVMPAQTIAEACVKAHQALYPDIEKLREKFLGKKLPKHGMIVNPDNGKVDVWENGVLIGSQG